MRNGKGYGFLAKGWLWVGLLLGVSACSGPFNYEINVLNYADLSGTFTVGQGGIRGCRKSVVSLRGDP